MALALVLILVRPEGAEDGGPHRAVGWTVAGLAAAAVPVRLAEGNQGRPDGAGAGRFLVR